MAYQRGGGPTGGASTSNGTSLILPFAMPRGAEGRGGVVEKAIADREAVNYNDPLADATACKRDVPLLQELGANVIRTYNIDPTQDHDTCMNLLADAGIYVFSDLAQPDQSIDRANPTWDLDLFTRYTDVVDALAKYSNVIGFFAGNEVTNNATYAPASAFVKAAVRDTKAYIKSKGYTTGVGYAADDDSGTRANVAAYFNCGDLTQGIDFWGYNIYSWCDPSNYVTSGYQNHTEEFSSYSVPVFFAEYGCNTGTANGAAGRDFSEVPVLYGPLMSPVFSGGIVYEYFEEANDYGLVSVSGDDLTVTKVKDFGAFSSQIHAVSPSSVNAAQYTPTNSGGGACPTVASTWEVAPTGLPPTPDKQVCDCMTSTLSCQVKGNLTGDAIADLFNYVCSRPGTTACDKGSEIYWDAATGTYGAYIGCNPQDQLSYVFDLYYKEQNSVSSACDFSGNATVVTPSNAGSSCSAAISQATAAAATGGNGGSSAISGSTTTGKKSDGMSMHASLNAGTWCWAGYLLTVALSGAGILLL